MSLDQVPSMVPGRNRQTGCSEPLQRQMQMRGQEDFRGANFLDQLGRRSMLHVGSRLKSFICIGVLATASASAQAQRAHKHFPYAYT